MSFLKYKKKLSKFSNQNIILPFIILKCSSSPMTPSFSKSFTWMNSGIESWMGLWVWGVGDCWA